MDRDDQDDMQRYRRAAEVALDQLDWCIGYLRRELRSPDALSQSAVDPQAPVRPRAGAPTVTFGETTSPAVVRTSEMKKVAREAAIVALTLVGRKAATSLTKQLAAKGPKLYQEFIGPRVDEAGGINELAKKVTDSKGLKGIAVGMAAESMLDRFTGAKNGGGLGRSARRVPAADSSSVKEVGSQARQATSQSSGTKKRTAKKAAPTRKAASSTTKKAPAPPAGRLPAPAKTSSSARKATSRRTSR
jgi:hypothetical protein